MNDSKLRHASFNKEGYEFFKDVRLDRAKPKKFIDKKRERHNQLKAKRCGICGGMVIMPCVLCNLPMEIYAERRSDREGRIFHSLEDLAKNLDKYTAGEDIDDAARRI